MCGFFSLILHTSKLKNIIIFYLLSLLRFLTIPSTFLHNYLIVFMLFFFFPCKSGKIKWLVVVVAVLIHATEKNKNRTSKLTSSASASLVLRRCSSDLVL